MSTTNSTICKCCGQYMSPQLVGNVNMCEDCKNAEIPEDRNPSTDAMRCALGLIMDRQYGAAMIVLKDQIEKNERSAMNH